MIKTKEDVNIAARSKTIRCLVKFITPGQSDSVIYISPAEHDKEIVDTSNQAGTERKEEIQRIIHLHAPRVGIIPKPARLMDGDGGVGGGPNLRNRTLADADIPEIKLEGFIFPKPKVAEKKRLPPEAFKGDPAMTSDRMDKMEKNIDMLTTTIGTLNTVITTLVTKPSITPVPTAGASTLNTPGAATVQIGPGTTHKAKKEDKK